jgi:hypothetical protein
MPAAAPTPFRLPDAPVESDLVAKYVRGLGDPTALELLALALLADNAEHVAACCRTDGRAFERQCGHRVDTVGGHVELVADRVSAAAPLR